MVLVLGLGNSLLSDDGIGVAIVRRLQALEPMAGVRLVEGGTGGLGLISLLAETPAAVIVDAVDAQLAPGAVMRLESDDLELDRGPVSMHTPRLVDLLAVTRQLGRCPRTVIMGVQVETVAPGALSWSVRRKLPAIVRAVKDEIERLRDGETARA